MELASQGPSPGHPVVILVAIKDGPAGMAAVREWAAFARLMAPNFRNPSSSLSHSAAGDVVNIRTLCSDPACGASELHAHHIQPLVVGAGSSWADVVSALLQEHPHARAVGLCGEGALPSRHLQDSLGALSKVLSDATLPTGVVARSCKRELGGASDQEGKAFIFSSAHGQGTAWLRDDFVGQLWCNRHLLSPTRLMEARLDTKTVKDSTLLEVVQELLIQKPPQTLSHATKSELSLMLVDGTAVLRPSFAVDSKISPVTDPDAKYKRYVTPAGNKDPRGITAPFVEGDEGEERTAIDRISIGTLSFTLIASQHMYQGFGQEQQEQEQEQGSLFQAKKTHSSTEVGLAIDRAPWPPMYIAETVATPEGLVIVTSVNCGYLDMATNFLISVRETSSAKVRQCVRACVCVRESETGRKRSVYSC